MASVSNLGTSEPFHKPEPWCTAGRVYRIRNMYYGEFIARCDYVHGTWASFTIVEGNNELLEAGRIAGSRIDVPREASSFEEMQP